MRLNNIESRGNKLTAASLQELFDATVMLFHTIRHAAERLHGKGRLTAGKRGILRSISEFGPQTVPQMARTRFVSRQHIQTLINELLKEGLVVLSVNPEHKRSRLVRLTERGERYLNEFYQKETVAFDSIDLGVSEDELASATGVLRSIKENLIYSDWMQSQC